MAYSERYNVPESLDKAYVGGANGPGSDASGYYHVDMPTPNGANGTYSTTGLSELQSTEERKLFDVVDNLRRLDFNNELELPQLVVCGSQSSGKSSVLEAISQLNFPRDDGTCTRFVTEIQFRRPVHEPEGVTIRIRPDPTRPSKIRRELEMHVFSSRDPKRLAENIQEAQKRLSALDRSQNFWKDVLHVHIVDQNVQPLTLVDLPGIIDHDKSDENISIVSDIVEHWIGQKRSIILAVVDAVNDPQRHSILTRARRADPRGERTFGIITKPDRVEHGKTEQAWIQCARNVRSSDPSLNLERGWHVLRNRGPDEKSYTPEQRDAAEIAFFENPKGNWKEVNPSYRGVSTLRQRLSALLYDHTRRQLPQIRADINSRLEMYHKEYDGIIEKLQEPDQLWQKYEKVCNNLQLAAHFAVEGVKGSGMRQSDNIPEQRVRTRIEEAHDAFFEDMTIRGHKLSYPGGEDLSPSSVLPESYLEDVRHVMKESRGPELPGYYNSLVIGELFENHSSLWYRIAEDHIERSRAHCSAFIVHMITVYLQGRLPALPTRLTEKITYHLETLLSKQKEAARQELQKLEEDRRRPPKTRNKTFEEKKRRAQSGEEQRAQLRVIDALENGAHNLDGSSLITPTRFQDAFGSDVAAKSAEDFGRDMLVYYEIARASFIDNVIIQVIERHMMRELGNLFRFNLGMSRDVFDQMVNEEDTRSLQDEKAMLEDKIGGLKRLHSALAV